MQKLKSTEIKELREQLTPSDNLCPILKSKMTGTAKRPVLDHCHSSSLVRAVISQAANTLLGRIENAFNKWAKQHTKLTLSEVLRNVADYLERDHLPIEHPEHRNRHKRRVKRWKNETLEKKIVAAGGVIPPKLSRRKLVDLYIDVCIMGEINAE